MQTVEVIKTAGAVVRGPCTLSLNRDQWSRRAHVLGVVPKRVSPVTLAEGQELFFKCGERLGIELPKGRLDGKTFAVMAADG